MPIATGHIYVMHVVWPQMIITEQSSKLQANLKVKENRTQAGKNGSASAPPADPTQNHTVLSPYST